MEKLQNVEGQIKAFDHTKHDYPRLLARAIYANLAFHDMGDDELKQLVLELSHGHKKAGHKDWLVLKMISVAILSEEERRA